MKVLFIRSGNNGLDPITQNQGESLIKAGTEVYYYDIKGKGVFGYLSNISKIRETIKDLKPNVIHAHYSLSGYIAVLSSGKTPMVVSLMGSDVNAANWLNRSLIWLFSVFGWDKIIVKSEQMKQKIKYIKSEVIPNGVDFENYFPIKKMVALSYLKWDKNNKHILFASDPSRQEKNYSLAHQALNLLNRKNVEVHFLMNIPQIEMPYYYNASDLLLLTSIHEGSPNVIKEAMACNCPIVTTDVGDVRTVIGNTDGCYITSFEPEDVAEKINMALEYAKRTNGRKNIKHLDNNLVAEKIVNLYKELLYGSGNS